MSNIITFFDPVTEEGQVWVTDDEGNPIEPEVPTNKPFRIYERKDKLIGISQDTYEMLEVVFDKMFKDKDRKYAKK